MNSVSEDFKDIIVTGAEGTFGTDLFVGHLPDSPDACVCLFDTGSFGEADLQNEIDKPTLQLLIRGAVGGYRDAYIKARSVRSLITAVKSSTLNGTKYIGTWITSDVLFIEMDDKRRPVFSINFRIQRS